MRNENVTPVVATVVILAVICCGQHSVRASGAPAERINAAITRQTPIADSARSFALARTVELTQSARSRPGKGVRCAVGLTLLPLAGTFIGMLVGATGVLAAGGSGESEGIVKSSMVV